MIRIELHRRNGKEWVSMGLFWADVKPCSCTYPFRRNGQERYEGQAFEVTVRYSENVMHTEKITFADKECFLLTTPQKLSSGRLSFRIFSWKQGRDGQ